MIKSKVIKITNKIARIFLRLFATCNLVYELEHRTEICEAFHPEPYEGYTIEIGKKYYESSNGPATILRIID